MDWPRKLLDYHAWRIENFARHLLTIPEGEFVRPTTGSFGTLGSLVGHLLVSERWFLNILSGQQAPMPKTEGELGHALVRAWYDLAAAYRRLSNDVDVAGMNHVLELPGRPGAEPRRMTRAEAMLQLVDHQAYHLGQVTFTLRHLGQPVAKGTTFFAYLFQ